MRGARQENKHVNVRAGVSANGTSRPSGQPTLRILLLGKEGKGYTLTWWDWPQSSAGSSDLHKDQMGVVSMGFGAQDWSQILTAAGLGAAPRPWVGRDAQTEGSSHGALLGGREKVEGNSMRGAPSDCI